jgi:hypothetical protein
MWQQISVDESPDTEVSAGNGGLMKYFAYGSNMLEQRLKARVPGAVRQTNAWVVGYSLRFNKQSIDQSGKCNIVDAENLHERVHGVLFDVPDAELPLLDELEKGYHHQGLLVVLPDNTTQRALGYVADAENINDTLKPYSWYHKLITAGAEQNRLPKEYVEALKTQPSLEDANPNRKGKRDAETVLAQYRASLLTP